MKNLSAMWLIALLLQVNCLRAGAADGITTIRIGSKVLVKDCTRLGLNLGGDNYYSGAALVKKRRTENFEGTSYRQCHFGPLQDERGAATWFNLSDSWKRALTGGRYTILSGPAKGTSGTIVEITTRKIQHQGRLKEFTYFVFDKRVEPGPPNGGLLVERMMLDQGQFRPLDGYWTTKENRIAIGDVPPGSFGQAAAVLNAKRQKAHLRFSTHYQRYGDTNGRWNVRFWSKALSGSPKLTVRADRSEWGASRSVELTPKWVKYELKLDVDRVPEPEGPNDNPHLLFLFEATGGEVLLDDVEIWMDGDTNPTVFRDDCVAALKSFRPGVLRYLQMGGNTLDNSLRPPLRAHRFTSMRGHECDPYASHNQAPYSLHEMYELCEYLGCDPWYCLPGTLSMEEIRSFIEYLAGPADTDYGRLRAELGHPRPWTEVFRNIHVEFGNEAWNNAGPYQVGGFNGADYWRDLIATAKDSPHFEPNIVFHAAGQAANSYRNRGILKNVPNADRFSVAPYILQSFSQAEAKELDTAAELFRWAFAWPMRRAGHREGAMRNNFEMASAQGIELSVYEINHHITHGDGPLQPRNTIVTSIGGGLNVANTMLGQLKDYGARTQCLFSFVQHSYNAHNIGRVRLWGTMLNMRKDHTRYRPTFLACRLANEVISGNLVETAHQGANPTFSATGVFDRRAGKETLDDLPCLHSYAFEDGSKRGLLVVNLDVEQSHPIRLSLSGKVKGDEAIGWLLAADRITANNEFEQASPQATIKQRPIAGFRTGWQYELPPHSMLGLTWETSR